MKQTQPVTFVGHPFTSIGKGEELRSAFSSYRSLDKNAKIFDIYKYSQRKDPDHLTACGPYEVKNLPSGIRIFHINGDEVSNVINHLSAQGESLNDGYNIAVPAWELPDYPADWARALDIFDEVWSISKFVHSSLVSAGLDAHYVGQSVELQQRSYLPRRFFNIRSSAFVFLAMVDLSSYSDRKNPQAAIDLYRRLRKKRPYDDIQLVLKAKAADNSAAEWVETIRDAIDRHVVIIDYPLTTFETHSLIAGCDCLVSLHRSEGFGRGAAEAMWLRRTAIATGWSGNMDYMDGYEGAVRYNLIPVMKGQYPRYEQQVWADPDIEYAEHIAQRMIDDTAMLKGLQSRGQFAVRKSCSSRSVGLRMLERTNNLEI